MKVGVGTSCQECTLNTRLWKEASGPWFCGGRRVEPRTISAACPHGLGTGTGPPVFWGAGSVVGKSARLLRTSCVPSDKLLSLSEPESPNRPRVPGGLTGRSAADWPPGSLVQDGHFAGSSWHVMAPRMDRKRNWSLNVQRRAPSTPHAPRTAWNAPCQAWKVSRSEPGG